MKVTIKTACGNVVTVKVDTSFQVWVDDDMLLEHTGPVAAEEDLRTPCCKGTYGSCHGASSLFEAQSGYVNFKVPSSSFIDSFQWWKYEDVIGEGALEIYFHNGSYVSYKGVPYDVIEEWIDTIELGESAGRFYNTRIKSTYEVFVQGEE